MEVMKMRMTLVTQVVLVTSLAGLSRQSRTETKNQTREWKQEEPMMWETNRNRLQRKQSVSGIVEQMSRKPRKLLVEVGRLALDEQIKT